MQDITASKQIIKYIIPFTYSSPYKKSISQLELSSHWEEIESSKRENIMEHIDILVRRNKNEKHPETIGRQFELNQNGRGANGLLKSKNGVYRYTYHDSNKSQQPFTFTISSIGLFLFETNIGFISYSIEYQGELPVQQIIDHNYFLKSFSKPYGTISYKPQIMDSIYTFLEEKNIYVDKKKVRLKVKKEESATEIVERLAEIDQTNDYRHLDPNEVVGLDAKVIEVSLGKLTRRLVEQLEPETFFHDHRSNNKVYPGHAITYTAITMDKTFLTFRPSEQKGMIENYLFRMRRTFKESYKPCVQDLQIENNDEIFQAFDNSYWGFSLEGLVNLTYLVEDEHTNKFFESNYYGNLERSYYYLYIIALHQRYALIKLSKEATLLPGTIHDLMLDQSNGIDRLREKIAYFNLRSSFMHVSYISHQDKIYQHIYKILQIDDLTKKVESEVESLGALVVLQKEVRNKKRENLFVGLTTVFAATSTISATWAIIKDFWLDEYQEIVFFIVSGIILLIGGLVIFGRDSIIKK